MSADGGHIPYPLLRPSATAAERRSAASLLEPSTQPPQIPPGNWGRISPIAPSGFTSDGFSHPSDQKRRATGQVQPPNGGCASSVMPSDWDRAGRTTDCGSGAISAGHGPDRG